MLPIGICVGFEDLPMAHAIGYDFVEVPLSDLAALPEGDFEELVDYVRAADIEVRGCYNMLPESIKITGEGVSARIQHDYLQKAFSRAEKLGARFIALDGENYEKIFKTLESIGYTGGVGIRSQSNGDFNVQARQALEYLREVQTR